MDQRHALEEEGTSPSRLLVCSTQPPQIIDLENRNQALQSEVQNAIPTASSKRNDPASWLPSSAPRHTLESHQSPINCIAFHPVFSSLASGSDDYTIKIWDWDLGELEKTIKGHTRAVLDVDYGGPRGAYLLASCSSDLTIKLWDPADDYKNIRTLPGHDHSVSAVRFVPTPTTAAPGSPTLLVSASRDRTLRIWDVTTGFCVRTIEGHAAWVRDVAPSPDGRFLVSAGDDRSVRLWDVSSSPGETEAKQIMFGHDHVVECCELAPATSYQHLAPLAGLKKPPPASSSAEFMASGSRDKTVRIWDARGICLLTLSGHDNWVRAVLFHPGGKYLLSASDDKTIRCWDLSQEGKCVKVVKDVHEGFIACMRWAPSLVKDNAAGLDGGEPGTPKRNGAEKAAADVQIRCIIATGCVDQKVRVFAN